MTQDEIIRMAREAGAELYAETLCVNGKDAHDFIERFAALVAAHEREKQAKQEPVATVVQSRPDTAVIDVHTGNDPLQLGTLLYAIPVRTKDLTDDEINDIPCGNVRQFARAIIAADREKNK